MAASLNWKELSWRECAGGLACFCGGGKKYQRKLCPKKLSRNTIPGICAASLEYTKRSNWELVLGSCNFEVKDKYDKQNTKKNEQILTI